MTETRTCRVCGADKPAAVVSETTLKSIDPLEAPICATCEHVQNHRLGEDVCSKCGDDVGTGFSLELEYPLGEAGLPAFVAFSLCGDCASWIACSIAYEAVDADDEAHERFIDLIKRERSIELEEPA